VVGTIMSGLLVGILLSRTLSGFIGDTLVVGVLCFGLPQDYVSYYFLSSRNNFLIISQSLMARTNYWFAFHLNQGATFMHEATLINVFSFAQFGAFWTTMVLLLSEEPFNLLVPQ
jgi:hypothetical protein